MKKLALLIATAISPLAFVNVAHADAALAQAKGCTACHQVDKKVIGPAYNAVAACYADKDAKKVAASKEKIIKHVKVGGAGTWGPVPMPAHAQLSEGDLIKLVDWVLSQKGGECPKEFKKG